MWCNTPPDDSDNKLTYETVLRKAKEHEAAVREYIWLVEENLTMTTAFQQMKQVAIDAFKVKKQSSRGSWKMSTFGSRERQQKPSRNQSCTNCGYKEHSTPDGKCTVKGATGGYCHKITHWESVCISKGLDQKKKKGTNSDSSSRQSRSPECYSRRSQTPIPRKPAMNTFQVNNSQQFSDEFSRMHFDSITTQPTQRWPQQGEI